jgi:hypothetical protein
MVGSPPKSTFLAAIKNHPKLFNSFPGLTCDLINKHLPLSTATVKGHMIRNLRGLISTRNNRQAVLGARQCVADMSSAEHTCSAQEDKIFCFAIIGDRHDSTIYSNLTGRFQVQSFEGMEYICVAYVYKLNESILCSMKSRVDAHMVEAFTSVYDKPEAYGHKPKHHVLNNTCSRAVQSFLVKKGVTRQNVVANNHQVNAVEPAANNAKYHLIAYPATLYHSCPIRMWSKMLPQM